MTVTFETIVTHVPASPMGLLPESLIPSAKPWDDTISVTIGIREPTAIIPSAHFPSEMSQRSNRPPPIIEQADPIRLGPHPRDSSGGKTE